MGSAKQNKKFNESIEYRRKHIKNIAQLYSWNIEYENNAQIIFTANDFNCVADGFVKMIITPETMDVVTELNHPKKGTTRLMRKNVTRKLMIGLFRYPRRHTTVETKYV